MVVAYDHMLAAIPDHWARGRCDMPHCTRFAAGYLYAKWISTEGREVIKATALCAQHATQAAFRLRVPWPSPPDPLGEDWHLDTAPATEGTLANYTALHARYRDVLALHEGCVAQQPLPQQRKP